MGEEHHCSIPAEEWTSRRDWSHSDNLPSFERHQHAHAAASELRFRRWFTAGCNFDAMLDMIDNPDINTMVNFKSWNHQSILFIKWLRNE